jgi:predicted Fe-Mo cluster-binding NifX family protein
MNKKIIFPCNLPGGLAAPFNWKFGRCEAFTMVIQNDSEIEEVEVVQNDAENTMGGAGPAAAKIVSDLDPTDIVVGRLGPNAHSALLKTGIRLHKIDISTPMNIKTALDRFNAGETKEINQPNATPHTGFGN